MYIQKNYHQIRALYVDEISWWKRTLLFTVCLRSSEMGQITTNNASRNQMLARGITAGDLINRIDTLHKIISMIPLLPFSYTQTVTLHIYEYLFIEIITTTVESVLCTRYNLNL